MTITPATFAVKPYLCYNPTLVSIYKNAIRFSRGAATMMELPRNIRFHCDEKGLFADAHEEGFKVIISGSWKDFVIYNRMLCEYILTHYKAGKMLFQVKSHGASLFEFKPITNVYEKLS